MYILNCSFNYTNGFFSLSVCIVFSSWISTLKFFIKIWKHWQLFFQIYFDAPFYVSYPSWTVIIHMFNGLISSHVTQSLIELIFLFYQSQIISKAVFNVNCLFSDSCILLFCSASELLIVSIVLVISSISVIHNFLLCSIIITTFP